MNINLTMTKENALKFADLLSNIDKLHTTPLGIEHIQRNLCLDTNDIVKWCKQKIKNPNSRITRKGKNWYVSDGGCVITVNAHSYTIITALPLSWIAAF